MYTKIFVLLALGMILAVGGCKKETFDSNGETIFRTGKNLKGEGLQDLAASDMKMLHSCVSCHGSNGTGTKDNPSITFADLSNSALHAIPYNDSLLIRFLDHELKSNGAVANTGVVWRMSSAEKRDLIAFLKTL
jgi:cytochrome c553